MSATMDIEGIYRRHVKTVYKVAFGYFGNAADAEDACQQVFCKLVEAPREFSGEAHERAWLIVCTQNLCKDMLKSAYRAKRSEMPADVADEQAEPHVDETLEAVLALPEVHRECVYLHYYEGYSTAQIAQMTGANPSTVRNRLSDARAKLKDALGGE